MRRANQAAAERAAGRRGGTERSSVSGARAAARSGGGGQAGKPAQADAGTDTGIIAGTDAGTVARAGTQDGPARQPAQPLGATVLAAPLEPGLYLVATPIGAARDITLRALDVLNGADLLAAEDTRTLRHLLAIHGIPLRGRRILSHHDHNAERAVPAILAAIARGEAAAFCSDAGTPLVADPGFTLAREVAAAGGRVNAVPGPSALLAALTVAGQPTDRFLFAGFAPAQAGPRRRWLGEVCGAGPTAVIFESPRRVKALLEELCDLDPNRAITLCRELTKRFEDVLRGTVAEILADIPEDGLRGEVVVVLGPAGASQPDDEGIRAALRVRLGTMTLRDAAAAVAAQTGRPRKDVYRMALAMQEG